MRGFLLILISVLTILVVAQAVSGATVSITQMPALYVSDYGAGTAHPINSYTLRPSGAVSTGAWMLLGTNDQTIFARIDARKDIGFTAGETRRFNVSNSDAYRWYYLYLQDGFTVGNSVEFALDELSPAPVPTAVDTTGIEIVIERAPLVIIVDFNRRATRVDHYNFTSSVNLPADQSWQLRGTNDPDILGSDNPGSFTLLDDRTDIGFTGDDPEEFTVTSPGSFLYYVFYLQSGFSVRGMHLAIELHETPPTPTPTPTPETPTPTPSPTITPTPTPTPPLGVDFEGSPRAGYVPLTVTFTDKSPGTFSNWSWDFGDGNTSSLQDPVHTYAFPGVFSVNLTVCTDGGCSWYARASYIYVIPTGTPTPTETPRYYIKIGGGGSGYTSSGTGSGSSSGGTGAGTGSAPGGNEPSGDQGGPGAPSDITGGTDSGTGSGSTGSGGGEASQGTGDTTGNGNPGPGEQRSVPVSIIQALIDALGDVVTTTGGLLEYLQNQLHSLFGW
jgi:PKD repeat protein